MNVPVQVGLDVGGVVREVGEAPALRVPQVDDEEDHVVVRHEGVAEGHLHVLDIPAGLEATLSARPAVGLRSAYVQTVAHPAVGIDALLEHPKRLRRHAHLADQVEHQGVVREPGYEPIERVLVRGKVPLLVILRRQLELLVKERVDLERGIRIELVPNKLV